VWLTPEHDEWLETVIESLVACEGVSSAEADACVDQLAFSARSRKIAHATVAGVWHVLRSFSRTEVDARVEPKELRAELFALAASTPVDAVIQRACAKHDVSVELLRRWLYADVPSARVVRVEELPRANQLRDAYNMALAQGLLATCKRVTITADELRAVVRAAKLRGLLVTIEKGGAKRSASSLSGVSGAELLTTEEEGPKIRASGPLALFRQTRKYAHALASFLPTLITGTRFSLDGELDEGVLHIDDASPLPRAWPEPVSADSTFERTLSKALARFGAGWTLRREPIVIEGDGELFFPDFVLERGGDRVVVEVVGFWTPDYLERKAFQLAKAGGVPMIVCVDETLACDPSRVTHADVLRFRRKLDPKALIEAAERACARRGSVLQSQA
jgi:predicted nuclease of restriction endonuclease-like RecB superfamily